MQAEIVAWDILEQRLFGAPGEVRHRVLWVSDYTLVDGTHPDLNNLLTAARNRGGVDGGARTLHVRPLYYGADIQQP